MRLTKRFLGSAVAMVALLATALPGHVSASSIPTADDRPNVLVIVTDDQREGLGMMPETRRWFRKDGTEFANGFVTTPMCCPSRASIFTGRYTHNHHVFSNDGEGGNLIQQSTMQYYLQQAGYETALFGKYLNGWPVSDPPPYFDRYALTSTISYRNRTWNVNGTLKVIPDYNTVYLARKADNFLHHAGADNPPWYMYLATAAPHYPFTPQTKYAHAAVPKWNGDPAVFEKDRSDKPPYVREMDAKLADGQGIRKAQLRTLPSVDDLVANLFHTLRDLGEARNTLVFFISDNGLMWAEHGLRHKKVPYDQALKVPFLVRWPDHFLAGAEDNRLVANIDIAPTVLQATGITPNPAYPIDGRSLLGASSLRKRLLMEQFPGQVHPTGSPWEDWASTRTSTYKYTEYYDANNAVMFREYYDLTKDPWELHNLLGDDNPTNDPDVAALTAQLAADRVCKGTSGSDPCP